MNLKFLRLATLITWEQIKRNRKWVMAGVVLIIILSAVAVKLNLLSPPNSIRIGLVGTFQENDLPEEVTKLASAGLVKAESDGTIKADLVSGWEVNNDATVFKFKLKDNLKWADNTPIKAVDLEFNIPNIDVTYPDDKTIQFSLKEPYSPLPSILTKPVFKRGSLLGTGHYKISKIEKSRIFITKITLVSADPKLPTIYLRFYPNEKVAMTGFNLGEVQALLGLANVKLYAQNPLVAVKRKTDYTKIVTVLFQTTDSLLKNRSLRQALSYETPKIEREETADNPYPSTYWAYDGEAKKYLSNPDQALAALDRAKSSLPEDKLHAEMILTATPNLEEVGKIIVESWKKLGFDCKLRVESGIPQNFQALLITQSIPIDPDQYSLWHATQIKTNLSKYDSKRADKDLEDGRKEIEQDERKAKYFDFQRTLLEDAPAIFLYFPKYNVIYLKGVKEKLDKILDVI